MLKETYMIANGDFMQPFSVYQCDRCGIELPENAPFEDQGDKTYCGDCAFLTEMISDKEYLEKYMYWIDIKGLRAVVHEGKIYVDTGKFEWERTSRDRESASYKEWRERIYKRDNYTCQHCGKYGGTLNAHHIKSYAKYPDLRLNIDNGITLCVDCHKTVHKKKGKKVKSHERS